MMRYGPTSYFSLTCVGPRRKLREPFPRKRVRAHRQRFVPGVGANVPYVYRTGTLVVSCDVSDGYKFRVRVKLISGTIMPETVANHSAFNVNK